MSKRLIEAIKSSNNIEVKYIAMTAPEELVHNTGAATAFGYENPLLYIQHISFETLGFLLKRGMVLDVTDFSFDNLVEANFEDHIFLLIKHGININHLKSADSKNAFALAIEKNFKPLASNLLLSGASITYNGVQIKYKASEEVTESEEFKDIALTERDADQINQEIELAKIADQIFEQKPDISYTDLLKDISFSIEDEEHNQHDYALISTRLWIRLKSFWQNMTYAQDFKNYINSAERAFPEKLKIQLDNLIKNLDEYSLAEEIIAYFKKLGNGVFPDAEASKIIAEELAKKYADITDEDSKHEIKYRIYNFFSYEGIALKADIKNDLLLKSIFIDELESNITNFNSEASALLHILSRVKFLSSPADYKIEFEETSADGKVINLLKETNPEALSELEEKSKVIYSNPARLESYLNEDLESFFKSIEENIEENIEEFWAKFNIALLRECLVNIYNNLITSQETKTLIENISVAMNYFSESPYEFELIHNEIFNDEDDNASYEGQGDENAVAITLPEMFKRGVSDNAEDAEGVEGSAVGEPLAKRARIGDDTDEADSNYQPDIHALDNAFNQMSNPDYYYQASDILAIAHTFKSSKDFHFTITSAGHEAHNITSILEPYKATLDTHSIIGAHNFNSNHWVAFTIFKSGEETYCLYIDSRGEGIATDFQDALNKVFGADIDCAYGKNTNQLETIYVNSGLFALRNAEMLAETSNEELVQGINGKNTIYSYSPAKTYSAEYQEAIMQLRFNFAIEYAEATLSKIREEYPEEIFENLKATLLGHEGNPADKDPALNTVFLKFVRDNLGLEVPFVLEVQGDLGSTTDDL